MINLINLVSGLLDPDSVHDDAGDVPPIPPQPTIDDSWKPFPDFGSPTANGREIAEGIINHVHDIAHNPSPEIVASGQGIANGILSHIDSVMNDPGSQHMADTWVDDLPKRS